MKYRVFIILAIIAFSIFAQQKEAGTGIVYGSDHAFIVEAPEGWVLDNKAGVSQGLHAVFYPNGGSWANSPVVMYVNTVNKKLEGINGPEGLITNDYERFKAESPNVKIEELPSLKTHDGVTALVRRFSGDKHGNFEAVAYIDTSNTVIIIALTSRSRTLFDSSLQSFEKLVSSVSYLTDDVRIEKN